MEINLVLNVRDARGNSQLYKALKTWLWATYFYLNEKYKYVHSFNFDLKLRKAQKCYNRFLIFIIYLQTKVSMQIELILFFPKETFCHQNDSLNYIQ